VADAFMEVNFQRKFDWEKDHVYTPAGIDEVKDEGRRKFMFLEGLGVSCRGFRNTGRCKQEWSLYIEAEGSLSFLSCSRGV